MDPNIAIILTALSAGAAAGFEVTVSEAVKDVYRELKELIHNKISPTEPQSQSLLNKYEQDPQVWNTAVTEKLIEHIINDDQEILQVSRKLMTLLNDYPKNKFNVELKGNIQGVNIGDNSKITMNFTDKPKRTKSK